MSFTSGSADYCRHVGRSKRLQSLTHRRSLLRVVQRNGGTGDHASFDLLQGYCGVHQELDAEIGFA